MELFSTCAGVDRTASGTERLFRIAISPSNVSASLIRPLIDIQRIDSGKYLNDRNTTIYICLLQILELLG